jgi:hypothetical protein
VSQYSEHDPMQQEAALIRGLGSGARRGRWQRRVILVGGVALAAAAAVILLAAVVFR